MATIDVIMPQMGESIAEGTLSRWIKKPGEAVKRDEPIFEISTDKVDAEIPAPAAGVLSEILVQEGETVAVQTVVARIDTEAAAGAAQPAAEAPVPAAPSPAPATRKPETESAPPRAAAAAPPNAPVAAERTPAPAAPAAAQTPAPAPRPAAERSRPGQVAEGNGEMETAEERLRRRSTPLVRKMAAEHNLDLSEIPGTGLAGRVTKNDILDYLDSGAAARHAAGAAPAAGAPTRTPPPSEPAAPAAEPPVPATAPQPRAPAPAPSVEPWEGDRVEPWSRIRKLTAEHMVMSRRVSPHVNTIFEIDYTRVAQLRSRKKQEYAERGVNLTFLAFIAKAAADALRRHPTLNAAVSGESTILRRDINLGIAVALDWGLIVPVIRHADELALLGLARAINDLGERARTKKLSPDEVQKGTFTITNPGVFGSVIGTPIINQPQSAILCVGSIEKQPAVITVDGTDSIAVRTKGMLSLAFDHRIVDGADADRFMADVKKTLQEFPEAAV
ncbi:MAG TPA: dihydrolipoamide acetyltransferase family protein [Gemmatimonadales bacterium]|nr:dihydrolipoamide acetyltransferase family protein [Gemmatimonadales bacterium]